MKKVWPDNKPDNAVLKAMAPELMLV